MEVMAAGVHDWLHQPLVVFHVDFARKVEAGLLFDGQGIHVRAQQDRFSGAVFEDGGDAVAADVGSDGVGIERLEMRDYFGGGGGLFERELGVRVEVLAELLVGG